MKVFGKYLSLLEIDDAWESMGIFYGSLFALVIVLRDFWGHVSFTCLSQKVLKLGNIISLFLRQSKNCHLVALVVH